MISKNFLIKNIIDNLKNNGIIVLNVLSEKEHLKLKDFINVFDKNLAEKFIIKNRVSYIKN